MKRSRVDEVQFGARGGPHRTLSAPLHSTGGPTIQYLGTTSSGGGGGVGNAIKSDASTIGGPPPTVQYTTCKIFFFLFE